MCKKKWKKDPHSLCHWWELMCHGTISLSGRSTDSFRVQAVWNPSWTPLPEEAWRQIEEEKQSSAWSKMKSFWFACPQCVGNGSNLQWFFSILCLEMGRGEHYVHQPGGRDDHGITARSRKEWTGDIVSNKSTGMERAGKKLQKSVFTWSYS